MGEGWSDFHAMLLMVKDADAQVASNLNYSGVYALAAYTMYGLTADSYYYGIRRVPYSTDMTKNGLTFRMIGDGNALPSTVPTAFGADGSQNSEAHNTGEVWATMLWECYAALLRDTPTRLSFDEANHRMRKYIVDAYKGTPVNPTVLQARDALLAVASAKDSIDYGEFWQAFAKRGAGMLATGPDSGSLDNNPVMESYVAGNALQVGTITLDDSLSSCDHDGVLDDGETGMLTIPVKNTGTGALSNTVVQLTASNPGVTLGAATINVGTSQPFQVVKATVPVTLHGVPGKSQITINVSVNDPMLAVAGPVTQNAGFRVNYDVNATGSATDDVEAPTTVWTASSDANLTTGEDFDRIENSATEHWWFGPDSPSPADAYLVSPPLHVSATGNFAVEFDHRYWFEYDQSMQVAYDGSVIELSSDNGVSWLDVGAKLAVGYTGTLDNQGANPLGGRKAFTSKSTGYPSFIHDKLDLGSTYAGKTVLLRLRVGSDDAVAEKGWELDNLAFSGIDDKPFATIVNDPNQCTNTPPVLTVGADQTVNEGAPVTLVASATDADNDPVTITWTQNGGPAVVLAGNGFVAPNVTADTVLTFEAIATDGKAVVGPKPQKVTVLNVNHPPVVTVTPATSTVDPGAMVTLTATATDPDGDPLGAFSWSQSGGPNVDLGGQGTATVTFVAPAVTVDTHLTIAVKVNDGKLDSPLALADVLVKAKAVSGNGNPVDKKKHGCSCNEADGLMPLLALLGLGLYRRRKRP
jgi:MYXO-CTERM domain-containing protein